MFVKSEWVRRGLFHFIVGRTKSYLYCFVCECVRERNLDWTCCVSFKSGVVSLSLFFYVAPTNIPKPPSLSQALHKPSSCGRNPVTMARATPSWQPQEQGFKEIYDLLEQQILHSSFADKAQIWQHLQHYSHLPDFNNYLAFIFSHAVVAL